MTLNELIREGYITLTRPDWQRGCTIEIHPNPTTYTVTYKVNDFIIEENFPVEELAQTGWIPAPLCPGHKDLTATMSGT